MLSNQVTVPTLSGTAGYLRKRVSDQVTVPTLSGTAGDLRKRVPGCRWALHPGVSLARGSSREGENPKTPGQGGDPKTDQGGPKPRLERGFPLPCCYEFRAAGLGAVQGAARASW